MSGRDISFSDEDLRGLEVPHNDALVVGMMVANTKLDKIFCTTGFSHSILYLSNLKRLGFSESDVRPMEQTIRGRTQVSGENNSQYHNLEFLVMDYPSAYDIILGTKGLGAIGAVVSIYHLLIRFRTEAGIGEVRGSQQIARDCEKAILEKARSKDPSISKVSVVIYLQSRHSTPWLEPS